MNQCMPSLHFTRVYSYVVLCACSVASQQKAVKQKMASSKGTLVKQFDVLKKESGTGSATGTEHVPFYLTMQEKQFFVTLVTLSWGWRLNDNGQKTCRQKTFRYRDSASKQPHMDD